MEKSTSRVAVSSSPQEMEVSNFSNDVEAWHDFFMLAGTAAATLMGLLFVALSLRIDIRAEQG